MTKYPKFQARPMSEMGNKPFSVSGGLLRGTVKMGIQIVNEKEFTVAISRDSNFAEMITLLSEFVYIFDKIDGYHILSDQYDDGCVDCTDERWAAFTKLYKQVTQ